MQQIQPNFDFSRSACEKVLNKQEKLLVTHFACSESKTFIVDRLCVEALSPRCAFCSPVLIAVVRKFFSFSSLVLAFDFVVIMQSLWAWAASNDSTLSRFIFDRVRLLIGSFIAIVQGQINSNGWELDDAKSEAQSRSTTFFGNQEKKAETRREFIGFSFSSLLEVRLKFVASHVELHSSN